MALPGRSGTPCGLWIRSGVSGPIRKQKSPRTVPFQQSSRNAVRTGESAFGRCRQIIPDFLAINQRKFPSASVTEVCAQSLARADTNTVSVRCKCLQHRSLRAYGGNVTARSLPGHKAHMSRGGSPRQSKKRNDLSPPEGLSAEKTESSTTRDSQGLLREAARARDQNPATILCRITTFLCPRVILFTLSDDATIKAIQGFAHRINSATPRQPLQSSASAPTPASGSRAGAFTSTLNREVRRVAESTPAILFRRDLSPTPGEEISLVAAMCRCTFLAIRST
jgi:hypothetical protein